MGWGKVSSWDLGHMIKMADTLIYGKKKTSKMFFTKTVGPISMKLGMQYWGLQHIIV